MELQRKHFLLTYFKTLSAVHDPFLESPEKPNTKLPPACFDKLVFNMSLRSQKRK